METIEALEEKYTSAYCRLSFDIWYQGYKDDVTKYMPEYSFEKALEQAFKDKKDTKIIHIDGCEICRTDDLKECIALALNFLCRSEQNMEYSIVFSLPFEQLKEADRIAYEHINRTIERMKFSKELCLHDYVIMIWSINRISARYLKMYDDSSLEYAIHFDGRKDTKRGKLAIDQGLYSDIVKWAIDYIDKNKDLILFVGMDYSHRERFQVSFGTDKLGIPADGSRNIPEYGFDSIEGNGVFSRLLSMPELDDFVREEV